MSDAAPGSAPGFGAHLRAARGGAADAAALRRQSIFVASFLADPRLAALVDAGRLVLVLWDGTAWCSGPAHIKCWQPVIYSHAILMGWGMANLRLALADHDEYLALPSPAVRSVQALVKYCFRGRTIARLWRYDAFCAACASADDEADLWARGPAGGGHPMQHYTTRKRQPYKHEHGKAFVDPEHAGPFEVLPRDTSAPCADTVAGGHVTLCRSQPAEWLRISTTFPPISLLQHKSMQASFCLRIVLYCSRMQGDAATAAARSACLCRRPHRAAPPSPAPG